MPQARQFQIEGASPDHAEALAELFATNGFGCYCRYWHFSGNHRDWLARCFHAPEENRAELLAAASAGSTEASGMIAKTADGELVGWLKLAPAVVMSKLYEQRLYKGLPIFAREPVGVWTVGCLFVREDHRRQGAATGLVAGAIGAARALGARSIEAFPRSDVDVADAALMMGPLALFTRAGFEIVHDFRPYPVLRLALGPPPSAPA
jgi:GNAT superfamily N-acetyltransferase